jgi:RHS repeat-associated protein
MLQPSRNYNVGRYRFGFNGQEKDDELKGSGNSLTFTFRIYDSRLGRFLSKDPLSKNYPWFTPYQFAGNMPIYSIDIEGKECFAANTAIWLAMWITRLKTATTDIIQSSTATAEYNNFNVPQDVQQKLKTDQFTSGIQVYGEALKGTADATVDIVTSIPGVETVGDIGGAFYYGAQGDYASAQIYGAAIFIPAVSGAAIKQATPLIKGTIKLFENGKQVERQAFKFGNYGYPGQKTFNTIVNSVKKGGDYVASSVDEAMEFLNTAFKDIPNETGKNASEFGYRIDVPESAKDGLKQGHQGTHINYYDKKNDIRGSITIDEP